MSERSEATERAAVSATEHPHPRRGRVHGCGRWQDDPLHVTVAQHPRRSRPLDRKGQRDDLGVEAGTFQPTAISEMVGPADAAA